MRLAAAVATALLLLACSSSTDVIDTRTLDCSPGQAISIMAGADRGNVGRVEHDAEDRFDLTVLVSNNSHADVTVTSIRAEQSNRASSRYAVETTYRKFDQTIPPGEDFTFHLPVTGRFSHPTGRPLVEPPGLALIVNVLLSSGDYYRCEFAIGAD